MKVKINAECSKSILQYFRPTIITVLFVFKTLFVFSSWPIKTGFIVSNDCVLQGYRTSRKFITAQSPLPSTIVDFLSLIYQEKCSCIVMMDEADTADKVGILPAEKRILHNC